MIRITIKAGKKEISEILDTDDIQEIKENFDECRGNGSNTWLENIDFDFYTRSLEINVDRLGEVNGGENAHFIFGYIENLWQSDYSPAMWFHGLSDSEMTIIVQKEYES